MKHFILCIFLGTTANLPFPSFAKDEDYSCRQFGGYDENVCQVSMYRLISSPKEFDGKIVRVTGLFADGPAPLLFADKEAYETSRTVDSVFLKIERGPSSEALLRQNRNHVTVIGRYSAASRTLADASGEVISGSITVSETSRASEAWGRYVHPGSLERSASKSE